MGDPNCVRAPSRYGATLTVASNAGTTVATCAKVGIEKVSVVTVVINPALVPITVFAACFLMPLMKLLKVVISINKVTGSSCVKSLAFHLLSFLYKSTELYA